MNHPSLNPGEHNCGGSFDAQFLPDDNVGDPNLEETLYNRKLPSIEPDINRLGIPQQLPPFTFDDAPVCFELVHHYSWDRSQQQNTVALPAFQNAPFEAEVHFPVVIPAVEPDNHPSVYGRNIPSTPLSVAPAVAKIPEAVHHKGRPETKFTPAVSHEFGTTPPAASAMAPARSGTTTLQEQPAPLGGFSDTATMRTAPPPRQHDLSRQPYSPTDGIVPYVNNMEALCPAIVRLVQTVPLLTEDDLLAGLAEPRNGGFVLSHKTLKQALNRVGLETDYKRYRAYITG